MKLSKVIAAAALGSSLVAGAAQADGMMDGMKFYVGADVAHNWFSWDSATKSALEAQSGKVVKSRQSLGLLGGVKFHENVGVELGYTFFNKMKLGTARDVAVKHRNMYLDLVGFMPVMDQVELLGAIGLGRHKIKGDANANNTSVSSSKTGLRLGAGAQYKFDDNIAARAMLRYQKLGHTEDGSKVFKHSTSLGLGVTYTF